MNQYKIWTSWLLKFLPVILLLVVWLWLFWPMMSGQTVVGFRDSAYLYFPMFQWIDEVWANGDIPLWNHYCNLGMPMIGDGTSSVLYPGKLVFSFRFLSFPARYGIYMGLHFLLAALSTYCLARCLKANRPGATLSALSYAAGGSVLFQVTNVIYLVSAAWLPLALLCVWKMIKTGHVHWAIGAGAVCAMIILGGDPQMVYHIGLIAAATSVFEFRKHRRWARRQQQHWRQNSEQEMAVEPIPFSNLKQIRNRLAVLGVMVAVTIALSLAQLLPTYEWSKFSERSHPKSPVNLYTAVSHAVGFSADSGEPNRTISESLFARTEPGTIADHAYQFSQSPWSMMELFWPNISGTIQPTHRRWTDGLAGAGRIWVPSLYIGLITIWLAIGGMRSFGMGRATWLTRVGLFFAIASFGWYGAAWLFYEIVPSTANDKIGPQVGGIYWMLVMVLPKYFSFRYPAKLFLIASLCLSLLAGLQLRSTRLKFSSFLVKLYLLFSAAGLVYLGNGFQKTFFSRVPPDGLFGPFDSAGCSSGLMIGVAHGVIVLGLAIAIFRKFSKPESSLVSRHIALWLIVLITAVDIVIANRWLLCEIPPTNFVSQRGGYVDNDWGKSSRFEVQKHRSGIHSRTWRDRALDGKVDSALPNTIFRARDESFIPGDWIKESSHTRLAEIVQWQRETLFPKHHLQHRIRLIGSFSSIWPLEYSRLLNELESNVDTENGNLLSDGILVVENVAAKKPNGTDTSIRLHWHQRRPMIFLADEKTSESIDEIGRLKPFAASDSESEIYVDNFENNAIAMRVDLNQPQWLVCNMFPDGNWYAKVSEKTSGDLTKIKLQRIGDLQQGIFLEPGAYSIDIFYQPKRFWIGAWVSGISWLLFVGGFVVFAVYRLKSKRRSQLALFEFVGPR